MTIAALLVASALAATPPLAVSAPAGPGADDQLRGQPQRGGQPSRPSQPQRSGEPEQDDQWGERPHRFGVGGSILISNRGASGGFRYWFGERVGVNLTAGFYTTAGNNPANSSSTVVIPSVLVMLTKPNETRQMDVRPYVGAGMNYSHAYGATPVRSPNVAQPRMYGIGGQAFGGVEVTFRDMDMMTLSGEGVYYVMPAYYANATTASGFTYTFAVHFYLK